MYKFSANLGLLWTEMSQIDAIYKAKDKGFDAVEFQFPYQYDSREIKKALDDVNDVDENGKAVIDPLTGKQSVTKGLKTIYIEQTKQTANNKLSPTDWYVTRKAEDSTTTIPSDVTTYRAAVRTKSGTIEKAITDAADHAAFMALFDAPVDSDGNPTGNAPINDWPDEL